MKPIIKFSKPWNRKVCCDFFTTIRPHDSVKYAVGNQFDSVVIINGEETKPMPVKVSRCYPMRLDDIHEVIFIYCCPLKFF